ncbi:MAG TPA: hypothetical protein VF306_07545 [Pirellulales bacterium]
MNQNLAFEGTPPRPFAPRGFVLMPRGGLKWEKSSAILASGDHWSIAPRRARQAFCYAYF